jgi:predicted nucleotide-binding protein
MPIAKTLQNTSIMEYALHHLEKEAAEIQGKIDHIRRQLGQKIASVAAAVAAPAAAAAAPRKKRVLSAAARKRIAAAQKKRWAEHRKTKAGKE